MHGNPNKKIIIDEIQKIPKLLDVVHDLIEEGHDHFVLTGSSARKLKRGSANLLGGRAAYRALFPFTSFELKEKFHLETALALGTLPKLLSLKEYESKIDYLQSYIRTYIREEIQMEQVVRKLEPFRNFLEVAAQMNGKILNFSKIEREVGATVKTIQNYYQILVDTHLGFFINGFHESWRKQLSQAPRFYFFDTGVSRALARQIQIPITPSTFEYGDLFEQFIIGECHKMNEYLNREYNFSYLRTKDDAEIDLIIDRPGKKRVLIEIKSKANIQREDLPHIITFKSEHPEVEAYCLSLDPYPKILKKFVAFLGKKDFRKSSFSKMIGSEFSGVIHFLEVMDAVETLEDLKPDGFPPSVRLHLLHGLRKGDWAIDIHKTSGWRITFQFEKNEFCNVKVENYH